MGGAAEDNAGFGDFASFSSCCSSLAGVAQSNDSRSRTLLFVACSLALLMVVEMSAGVMLGSIGLIADAMHMLFHALGVGVTLWGTLNARRGRTAAFSYGFARYEVLTTFSNATLLIFMQLFLLSGIVHRLIEPANFANDTASPTLKVLFGGAGIALNVWAVLTLGSRSGDALSRFGAAASAASLGGGSGNRQQSGGGPTNRSGSNDGGAAAASLYSDALSSLFLVISAFAAPHIGFVTADVLQALASAAVTLNIVVPLAAATADCLLQAVPASAALALERARRDVMGIDGVLEVTSQHYWLQAPGHGVCTIALRVRNDAVEGVVLAAARRAYENVAIDLTVQVEKDPKIETWAELAAGMGLMAGTGGGAQNTTGNFSIAVVATADETNAHTQTQTTHAISSTTTQATTAVQRAGHGGGHGHSGNMQHGHAHHDEDARDH